MVRAKDDPVLNRLFEGSTGDEGAGGDRDEAREALRRDVLAITDGVSDDASIEPLDDGLISAYLDDALDAAERTALEARLAASSMLRDQVVAASLAREAGLNSGVAMPPALTADYDAVPGPAKAVSAAVPDRPAGLIGRLFGAPMPARRWLAASLPVLVLAVVVAAIGPKIFGERAALKSPGEAAGTVVTKPAADAEVKLKRAEEREADRRATKRGRKRDAAPQPVDTMKQKPKAAPRVAEKPAAAGRMAKKASPAGQAGGGKDKNIAVLTTTVVPLSSELRDAVVSLGRSQLGAEKAEPAKKEEAKRRSYALPGPSTGSSADKTARESRSDNPVAGMLSQGVARPTSRQIDIINRAVAPDCTKNPAACCGSHRIDQDLLNRLLTSEPLGSVKVLHLSSRACYLTLP